MRRVKLDQIDLRILLNLQSNGRITNLELSKRVSISAPPCLRRVRVLDEAGYITGYHAEIDGAMLNYKETFFALVGLNSQAQNVLLDFEEHMARWSEVRECHMIRGGGDFLLKTVEDCIQDILREINAKILKIHIANTQEKNTCKT